MKRADLRRLIETVFAARAEEIGCSAFFEALPRYVDLQMAGYDAAQTLPDVIQHIRQCAECEEVYQALLQITATRPSDPPM
jgi:hypothetical protein